MPEAEGNIVKFPTSRVVRFQMRPAGPNAEIRELDRALWSIDHAIAALKRQRQSLVLRYLNATVRHSRRQGREKARKRLSRPDR